MVEVADALNPRSVIASSDIELRWQSPGSGRELRIDLKELFAEVPEDW